MAAADSDNRCSRAFASLVTSICLTLSAIATTSAFAASPSGNIATIFGEGVGVVDASSGSVTSVSQGEPPLVHAASVVFKDPNTLVVGDALAPAIFEIDVETGTVKTVSTRGDLDHPNSLVVAPDGNYLVEVGVGEVKIVKVDAETGGQQVLFTDPLFSPRKLELAENGDLLLVADLPDGGALARISRDSFSVSAISSGGLFEGPRDVDQHPDGGWLVADWAAGLGSRGAVIRVMPNGTQSILSEGGLLGEDAEAITVAEASRKAFVASGETVVEVDLDTGNQRLLAEDFPGDQFGGGYTDLDGVFSVPEPTTALLQLTAFAALGVVSIFRSVRRRRHPAHEDKVDALFLESPKQLTELAHRSRRASQGQRAAAPPRSAASRGAARAAPRA